MSDGIFQNPGANPVGWRQQKLRDNGDNTASPFTYPRYLDAITCKIGDTISAITNNWYGLIDLDAQGGTVGTFHNFFRIWVDKSPAARGTITPYVITAITNVQATLTPLPQASFTQNGTSSLEIDMLLSPSSMRTNVVAGNTPFIQVPSGMTLTTTAVNTATPFANGFTFTPAVGDICVNAINTTGGTVIFNLMTIYGVY